MPLAYAALAGIAFNALGWSLPLPIPRGIGLAAATLPVMLVNLGLELARAKLQDYDWNVFMAVGIKLLVTPVIALGLAAVMGMTGLTRSVSGPGSRHANRGRRLAHRHRISRRALILSPASSFSQPSAAPSR